MQIKMEEFWLQKMVFKKGKKIMLCSEFIFQKLGNKMSSSLKFLLLNPERHFTEVLQQARAVILAGGTMQPVTILNYKVNSNLLNTNRLLI